MEESDGAKQGERERQKHSLRQGGREMVWTKEMKVGRIIRKKWNERLEDGGSGNTELGLRR